MEWYYRNAHLGGAGGMATVGDFGFDSAASQSVNPFATALSRYRINRRENKKSVRVV